MLFGFQQGDCIAGYSKEKMIRNLCQDANKDAIPQGSVVCNQESLASLMISVINQSLLCAWRMVQNRSILVARCCREQFPQTYIQTDEGFCASTHMFVSWSGKQSGLQVLRRESGCSWSPVLLPPSPSPAPALCSICYSLNPTATGLSSCCKEWLQPEQKWEKYDIPSSCLVEVTGRYYVWISGWLKDDCVTTLPQWPYLTFFPYCSFWIHLVFYR